MQRVWHGIGGTHRMDERNVKYPFFEEISSGLDELEALGKQWVLPYVPTFRRLMVSRARTAAASSQR
jgi:hypothetical protein